MRCSCKKQALATRRHCSWAFSLIIPGGVECHVVVRLHPLHKGCSFRRHDLPDGTAVTLSIVNGLCTHVSHATTGSVADAVPGQWSYTIGPCRGIELGDHLWLSRYLLLRLSEQFRVCHTSHRSIHPATVLIATLTACAALCVSCARRVKTRLMSVLVFSSLVRTSSTDFRCKFQKCQFFAHR